MRKLILKQIDRQERKLGASLDWLRHIANASLPAFLKFLLTAPLASHRRQLPKDAWHVARLIATLHKDCGSCAQTVVNLARKDGIPRLLLNAVLNEQPRQLPDQLEDVYHFTRAVLRQTGDVAPLRERLQAWYGEQALVDLALAIATARIIPTTKRALGHVQSCATLRAAA